ncbi:MAG TPA: SGNH/GDSL hydrolase family protein, partial [Jatrophihabitans sp.]|nr:SGNH/GDSL hydrolase family protein [Jatrophihabitans sp.]
MRYVAIGDSVTEGIGDELPDGTARGWADLVAECLGRTGELVHYANLAVRGRLLESIVREQVPAALGLTPTPTLMTFNGGGNDLMRPSVELRQLLELTELAVRQVLDAGVRRLLLACADPSDRLPFGRIIHRRGAALTDAVAELAARHRVTFVN